jgi:hypothetical protein
MKIEWDIIRGPSFFLLVLQIPTIFSGTRINAKGDHLPWHFFYSSSILESKANVLELRLGPRINYLVKPTRILVEPQRVDAILSPRNYPKAKLESLQDFAYVKKYKATNTGSQEARKQKKGGIYPIESASAI